MAQRSGSLVCSMLAVGFTVVSGCTAFGPMPTMPPPAGDAGPPPPMADAAMPPPPMSDAGPPPATPDAAMPPAPTGFRCVWTASANRIGYALRIRATDMTGVRTIPSSTNETRSMSGSHIRLWALGSGAEVDSDASGWATYSLAGTPGGRINAHPYLDTWRFGPDPALAREILNIADLQGLSDRSCADLGIQLETCPTPDLCVSGGWTVAPESFCQIDLDTRGATFWTDPEILESLRGDPVMRAVIFTSGTNSAADCLPVP